MDVNIISNTFRIHYSEASQESTIEQLDYVFGRTFALVPVLLKATGDG